MTSVFFLRGDFRIRVREWLQALRANGIRYRVTSTKRTRAAQTVLWNRFLAGKSKFPAARPGTSKHETGQAIDVVFDDPAGLEIAVRSAGIHLLRWAGPGDAVHFDQPSELPCPPC